MPKLAEACVESGSEQVKEWLLLNFSPSSDNLYTVSSHIIYHLMNTETLNSIRKFRDDRNWGLFHNPKDLALSITLEAAELLENFQWKTAEEAVSAKSAEIRKELADVLIYSALLADRMGLDLDEIILEKLAENEAKYPAEKFYGRAAKYTEE